MHTIRLLGPPVVERDGLSVVLPYRRAMALVAWLAVEGPQHRRDLAAFLWADGRPERAAGNLRHAVHTVHARLPGLLQATRRSLALQDFQADVHAAARAGPEEAARLVRGTFCHGLELPRCAPFEDWLHVQRARWEAVHLANLERVAEERLRAGEAGEALEAALRAVAVDSLRAPAHELVLRSHLARGERGLALRHLERLRRKLRDELGSPVPEDLELLFSA